MAEKLMNSTEKERLKKIIKDRELHGDYGKRLLLIEGEKKPPDETVINAITFFKEHGVKKIIDIGCGIGRHSLLFAREGFDATAFDLSKAALETVKKRAREEKLGNVHTLQGDGWKIPVPDGAFDAALSFRVLDTHFYGTGNREDAIREMARVLKPGGDALVELVSPKYELKYLLETFKDAKLQPLSVALYAEIFVDLWVIKAKKNSGLLDRVETAVGAVKLEPYIQEHLSEIPGEQREYDVLLERHGSTEKIGWVYFGYMKVRDASIESGADYTALKEDIGDNEKIAYIRLFRPFQYSKDIGEPEGKDIANAVLSQLLNEFQSEGVVGASCYAKDERMQDVLEKAGFQKIGEDVYFKKL